MRYSLNISSSYKQEVETHLRGPEYKACLHEIAMWLREKDKYGDDPKTTWSAVRDQVNLIFNEYGIDPFE